MINVRNEFVREFNLHKETEYPKSFIKTTELVTEGRDSFRFLYRTLLQKDIIRERLIEKEYLKESFDELLYKLHDDLIHYFRFSIEILRYIHNSSSEFLSLDERINYAFLFKSGLSTSELALLYYYIVLYTNSNDKEIIKKLKLFDETDSKILLLNSHFNWL